jgi:hypothetical protein
MFFNIHCLHKSLQHDDDLHKSLCPARGSSTKNGVALSLNPDNQIILPP